MVVQEIQPVDSKQHMLNPTDIFLVAANDYIEIYWSVPNVTVNIQHLAASGTPTKPSTQSVVATMSFVSALP